MNAYSIEPAAHGPPGDELSDAERISLCETLDRVLNKGVVVAGEVMISVANIDLIYLGLQLVLTSVESARQPGLFENARSPLGANA